MTAPLTLYGETLWISPYVFASIVALREKGLPFEVTEVALIHDEHRRDDYAAPSITAKVPALRHGDFWLAESSAIAEYLEDAFPPPSSPPLFPVDPRQRARARQLMAWLRSDLMALREERPTSTMFYDRASEPLSPGGHKAADELVRVAAAVVPSDGGGLFGAWSLVDADLGFMLHRLLLNDEEVPARVRAYAETQWRRPSVREFVEHARPATIPAEYWTFSGLRPPQPRRR